MKNKLGIFTALILSLIIASSAFAMPETVSVKKLGVAANVKVSKTAKTKKRRHHRHRKFRKMKKTTVTTTTTTTTPKKNK
ncbi:MAG: hypothetical protein ABJA66_07530 [Actinomycetota bacterium]